MFSLIKQVFISLLGFSGSSAIKHVSLNNESRMTRPALINLNHIQHSYYLLVVSLDKFNGSCNVFYY